MRPGSSHGAAARSSRPRRRSPMPPSGAPAAAAPPDRGRAAGGSCPQSAPTHRPARAPSGARTPPTATAAPTGRARTAATSSATRAGTRTRSPATARTPAARRHSGAQADGGEDRDRQVDRDDERPAVVERHRAHQPHQRLPRRPARLLDRVARGVAAVVGDRRRQAADGVGPQVRVRRDEDGGGEHDPAEGRGRPAAERRARRDLRPAVASATASPRGSRGRRRRTGTCRRRPARTRPPAATSQARPPRPQAPSPADPPAERPPVGEHGEQGEERRHRLEHHLARVLDRPRVDGEEQPADRRQRGERDRGQRPEHRLHRAGDGELGLRQVVGGGRGRRPVGDLGRGRQRARARGR